MWSAAYRQPGNAPLWRPVATSTGTVIAGQSGRQSCAW